MKTVLSKAPLSSVTFGALLLAAGLSLSCLPCAHAQSGPPTLNLQLWLKADAGVVTNTAGVVTGWTDQSAAHHDAAVPASAGAPVFVASDAALNHKPVVQFNPSQYMDLTSTLDILGDLSSFAVLRLHYQAFPDYRGIWDQASPLNAVPFPNEWFVYNSGRLCVQRGDGVDTGYHYGVDYDDSFSTGIVTTNKYIELGFAVSGTNISFFQNNVDYGHDDIFTTQPFLGGGIPIRIGGRYGVSSGSANPLDGEIAELLIYDRTLSSDESAALWNYLATKYGLAYQVTCTLTTSPTNGSTLAVPATIIATATATTLGTTVSRVDFLANGSRVASAAGKPYTVPLSVLSPGSLTLQAVVVDDLNLGTTSAPVTFTVTGTAPTFTGSPNLRLWLKADAGVTADTTGAVAQWADQTTNANNAVQGALGNPPNLVSNAVNGQPAIRLNNSGYLQIPYSSNLNIVGDMACLAVVEQPADSDYRMVWYQGGSAGYPSPNALMLAGNTPVPNRGRGAEKAQDLYYGTSPLAPGRFAIVAFSQAGTNMSQFLNTLPNGTGTATVTPFDGDGASGLYGETLTFIGARGDFYHLASSDITLAEMMIFNTALSAADLSQIQGYLAAKYGILIVVQGANQAPTVSITSPSDGSSMAVPATFTVTATGNDVDGALAKVELFVNGGSFGALSAAPYRWAVEAMTPGPITLRVVATDNLGATATNTVTVTGTGAKPGFTPGSNLKLWLKAGAGVTADGSGNVMGWADQSGNGNNASAQTGNTPTLITNAGNGLPSLHFDPALTAYLQIPHSDSMAITGDTACFAVLNPAAANANNYRMIFYQGNSYPAPDGWMLVPGGYSTANRGDGTNQNLYQAKVPLVALQYSVVGFSQAGTNVSTFLNGQSSGETFATSAPVAPLDGDFPTYIGSRGDFYSYLAADLAELMIFNSAVSGTDLDAVRRYLGAKYGIAFVQPGQLGGPSLGVTRQAGGTLVISWPASVSGYILESASILPASTWTPVPGVANNQVTITPTGRQQYYRLRLP